MFSKDGDIAFVIRAIMRYRPFVFVGIILVLGACFFGFMIRVAEAPLSRNKATSNFSSLENCLWISIITMTTVGFGDITPVTTGGRIIMIFCSVFGVVIISLMVVTVTNTLNMNQNENKAFMLLRRLRVKEKLEDNAAKTIGLLGRYHASKGIRSRKNTAQKLIHSKDKFREIRR